MLSVVRYDSFGDLRAAWDPLVAAAEARGPFLSWEWQNLWWQTFGADAELWLLAVREGDASVGIAPFMVRQGRVTFSCGEDVCDYLDIVAHRGREEDVARAVADHLLRQDWLDLDLYCLTGDSTAYCYLPDRLAEGGVEATTAPLDVCPVLDLPGDWEAYLAGLPKKDRHELRRKMRRLGDAGRVRTYALVDGEIGAPEVEDFLSLQKMSTPEKAVFMDERMERFFRGIFARLAHEGLLRLYFMELDGRRVATALCFDQRDELLLYNSGYDPAYGRLSTGFLLNAACLQDAMTMGRRRFDFLRGDERYKYDLGGKDIPIYRLLAKRRS